MDVSFDQQIINGIAMGVQSLARDKGLTPANVRPLEWHIVAHEYAQQICYTIDVRKRMIEKWCNNCLIAILEDQTGGDLAKIQPLTQKAAFTLIAHFLSQMWMKNFIWLNFKNIYFLKLQNVVFSKAIKDRNGYKDRDCLLFQTQQCRHGRQRNSFQRHGKNMEMCTNTKRLNIRARETKS